MGIDLKAIYTNLKNWDFETLGSYKLREEEAKVLLDRFAIGKSDNKEAVKAYLSNCYKSALVCGDLEMQERLIKAMIAFDDKTREERGDK